MTGGLSSGQRQLNIGVGVHNFSQSTEIAFEVRILFQLSLNLWSGNVLTELVWTVSML
jgi:hypothetical protein